MIQSILSGTFPALLLMLLAGSCLAIIAHLLRQDWWLGALLAAFLLSPAVMPDLNQSVFRGDFKGSAKIAAQKQADEKAATALREDHEAKLKAYDAESHRVQSALLNTGVTPVAVTDYVDKRQRDRQILNAELTEIEDTQTAEAATRIEAMQTALEKRMALHRAFLGYAGLAALALLLPLIMQGLHVSFKRDVLREAITLAIAQLLIAGLFIAAMLWGHSTFIGDLPLPALVLIALTPSVPIAATWLGKLLHSASTNQQSMLKDETLVPALRLAHWLTLIPVLLALVWLLHAQAFFATQENPFTAPGFLILGTICLAFAAPLLLGIGVSYLQSRCNSPKPLLNYPFIALLCTPAILFAAYQMQLPLIPALIAGLFPLTLINRHSDTDQENDEIETKANSSTLDTLTRFLIGPFAIVAIFQPVNYFANFNILALLAILGLFIIARFGSSFLATRFVINRQASTARTLALLGVSTGLLPLIITWACYRYGLLPSSFFIATVLAIVILRLVSVNVLQK